MVLFRRNNSPLVFVLLRVYEEELEPLKKMIVENGGAVRLNDKKMPIIFTQSCNYSKLIWPERNKTLIYDIKFIKECVRRRKIVDPEPYRLSEMPLYSECLMTHFLYGGCNCRGPGTASAAAAPAVPAPTVKNRHTVFQIQSQTSSVAEEDFFTASSQMSEREAGIANPTENSEDPLATTDLNRSVKSERSSSGDRISLNCTTRVNIEINVLSPSQSSGGSSNSTIDQSQAVTRPATMHRPRELSSGDDRLAEPIDENEKRPCSVEYHTQLEPKLRTVAQRKKDMESSLGLGSKKRQQRTPTTLTDGRDAPSVDSTPENTSAILEEVTRSAPSCENEGADDDLVKNEPESLPPSPAKSDASTIMATSAEPSIPSSRKRLHSQTTGTESLPESNWITTEDWQEQDDVNHPVSKYMRCDDGERRLLKDSQQSSRPLSEKPSNCSTPNDSKKRSSMVLNTFSKNYQQKIKSPTSAELASANDAEKSKYFDAPRVTCTSSTSDESDDDHILITRVPLTRKKDNLVSVLSSDSENENSASKTSLNDEDWNKPGPSGTKEHSRAREDISSGDSSQDERRDGSEPREINKSTESSRSQNARNVKDITNNKKDSAHGEHSARLRVRRLSDLESIISFDDDRIDSISTKTRDKTKKNDKSVENHRKPGKTEANREPSVDSSNSDSNQSSYNAKVIAAKNKRADHTTMKTPSGRSETNDDRTRRRKIRHDDDSIAKKAKATNGRTRLPSIEIVQVDSDSNNENTGSRPATVARGKKSDQSKHPSKSRNRRKDTCLSSATDSDSSMSTHPLHNADLYTKLSLARAKTLESREDESGYRTWYSDSERRDIILYIVDKKAISLCKGEAFFQVMASEKIFRHRSALSLYNEFRKMLKEIDHYASLFNLTASTVMKFKRLRGDYR